jgi:hypothetical protein
MDSLILDLPWSGTVLISPDVPDGPVDIKLFLDVHQGPIRCLFMKKTDTKKSHATVQSQCYFPRIIR